MVGEKQSLSYVQFSEEHCDGCSLCMKVCPTRAIRIRNDRSVCIVDLCIGCGECVRVCATGAIDINIKGMSQPGKDRLSATIISPVLYPQFIGVMPDDILLGLRRLGFENIVEPSYYLEMFQFSTETFIVKNRKTGKVPWPIISPVCPVVLQLIAFKYQSLLPHILPIRVPIEFMITETRQKFSTVYGVKPKEIALNFITPCLSEAVSGNLFYSNDMARIDRPVGINNVYAKLFKKLQEIRKIDLLPISDEQLGSFTSGRCLMWGLSGGEISGMRIDNAMAVSGLKETVDYLDKIELGLFGEVEYIEFRTCREGCVNGLLSAIDKYWAKSNIVRMARMFGLRRRLSREKIRRLYNKGWFFPDKRPLEIQAQKEPLSIGALEEIDKIVSMIKGKDCSACGAPDCRTFAEDVVRGLARMDDCVIYRTDRMTADNGIE